MPYRSRVLNSLHDRFHRDRAALFVELLAPLPGATLLDLGGGSGSLASKINDLCPIRVTVADISDDHRAAAERRGFQHQVITPNAPLPFGDQAFDFVLCNSVIEHVTLPKERCGPSTSLPRRTWHTESRRAQKAFCAELMRVGRGFFVQTPHKHFPIDQHVWLPFVQYLSHRATARLVAFTDRWWIKKCGVADWELLTPRELRDMLPGCHIRVETLLGMPKSIVAFRCVRELGSIGV